MIKKILLMLFLGLVMLTMAVTTNNITLLNVSYDATREFYDSFNHFFIEGWKEKADQIITVNQSHGGSGAQARAVTQGLPADIVTLASALDIDFIAQKTHLIPLDWQRQFPNNSCPYTSTIVFLVRKNNPKQVKDWPDLLKPGIKIIMPNPKTSGGARWDYLAAWGYAIKKYHNEQQAITFLKALYQHIPVLEPGARGATNTFTQRNLGDVLITWENEAYMILTKLGKDQYDIIWPSVSILAEPPIAVVFGNTNKKGTTRVAKAYLETLYSPVAQQLIARFFLRPANQVIAAKYNRFFPQVKMITIQELGGWQAVQQKHFANGALFDQIYAAGEL